MNNYKSIKRAWLTSVLAFVVCCVMFFGSTFAWFNDNTTTTITPIVSGTLKSELVNLGWDGNVVEGGFATGNRMAFGTSTGNTAVNWEPNGVYRTQYFQIKNTGDLPLKFRFELEFTQAKLAEVINFELYECVVSEEKILSDRLVGTFDYTMAAAEGTGTTVSLVYPEAEEGMSGLSAETPANILVAFNEIFQLPNSATKDSTSSVFYLRGTMDNTSDLNYMGQTISELKLHVKTTQSQNTEWETASQPSNLASMFTSFAMPSIDDSLLQPAAPSVPETFAPATEAPVTEAPVTEAPATDAPVTAAPETEVPATEAPETEVIVLPPVTEAETVDNDFENPNGAWYEEGTTASEEETTGGSWYEDGTEADTQETTGGSWLD